MYIQLKQNAFWLSALALLTVLLPARAGTAERPLICTSASLASCAGESPLEKVTIAYSSISGNMAPLWITQERGFFRKYGLDVQLVFIESGTTTVQSLISRDAAFAQMAGAAVVQSHLRGSDVVMIAGVINTLTFKLYVDKNIKQPGQLKGKSVAVTRFGSSTDFALRYALETYGLVPEKDVTIVQAGSMPAIFGQLEAGWIHGAMLSAPFTLRAKNLGFPLLADLQMLGLEYQHTGLATTQALIKSRPDLVRNVMKAYVEGIHYYKTQRAESLKVLAKYLKTADPDALAEIYDDIGLDLTPQKPYPTLRGIEIMLKELAAKDPKAKGARPEEFVDLTFIKELDSSGFIDRLYKTQPAVARREDPPATSASTALGKSGPPAEKPRTVAVAAKSVAFASPSEYTVQTGDTLSRLAVRYYGDPFKWKKIYDANKQTMRNPDYIYVGQRIMIPA
jgi:NitT/TauT family transport system substrate-binding protein